MNKLRILYYDFADISYSSYFINGFLANQRRWQYDFRISKVIPHPLKAILKDPFYRSISSKICIFEVMTRVSNFFFCIDTHDSNKSIHNGGGPGYGIPIMRHVKYYFKVNYNKSLIDHDQNLLPFRKKIIPAPLFFPIASDRPLINIRSITQSFDAEHPMTVAKSRLVHLANSPNIRQLRKLRNVPKIRDVFFVHTAYGGKHKTADDFRCRIIDAIRGARDINGVAGFSRRLIKSKNLPLQLGNYCAGRYRRRKYLKCLAGARLGIYVRGLHDCISFKLGEQLAVGLPIVGQPIANNRDFYYANSEWSKQFNFETPEEIVKEVQRLLKNPSELMEIGRLNKRIFDFQFTPDAAVTNMLSTVLS